MFTNIKFEVSANVLEINNDVVELDMDMLDNIGGGEGSTSMPYPGK